MHVTLPNSSLPARASAFSPGPHASSRPGLIVVGDDPLAARCSSGPLSLSHTVEKMATLEAARARVRSLQKGIVVTELELSAGDAIELCTLAKTVSRAVLVLAVTSNPTRVPRALIEGCNSVLLKPFAPNLLYARLGRLTRDLQTVCAFPAVTVATGTNQHWPGVACPGCGHSGATSFDATSLRRAWYACLACEHVWIAKRQ
jgi:CheY-like chemotaxis protein